MEEICECGSVHSLNTKVVCVESYAFDKMIESLNKYQGILIITKDEQIANKVASVCNKIIKTIFLSNNFPSVLEAENIEDYQQDLVLAIGDEKVISVAKYYAYSCECELIIYPTGDFVDITFSKFARLYDGFQFVLFSTVEPSQIFLSLDDNSYCEKTTIYLSAKFVAIFDGIVAEKVYTQNLCKKMQGFLKRALDKYMCVRPENDRDKLRRDSWLMIRIGQAMSYFGQTKFFFGGEKAVADALNMYRKSASFLELIGVALKLVVNSYASFFKGLTSFSQPNLNKHIDAISKLFCVSSSLIFKRLVNSELINDPKTNNRYKNHYPFLKDMLSICLGKVYQIWTSLDGENRTLKKHNIGARAVEKCFAVSPTIFSQPCTLHLMLSFGYMDKLL